MALTDSAKCLGSSGSSILGRPWPTSQNGQRRVQISPIIMNVAVPLVKHSLILGQDASSHTVCIFCSRRMFLISKNFFPGSLARIHSGFFNFCSNGTTLIGMRAVLSAPFSLMPRLGSFFTSSLMVMCSFCRYKGCLKSL